MYCVSCVVVAAAACIARRRPSVALELSLSPAQHLSEPAVGEQAAAHVRGAKNKLQLT